jgi:tetratricopeptide (TPR) repeat protein
MGRRNRPKAPKFFIVIGFSACLAGLIFLSSVAASFSQTSQLSSPDQNIEISTKELPPEVQKILFNLHKTNKLEQYYVKKPKKVTTVWATGAARDYQPWREDGPYFRGVDYIFSGNYSKAISEFNKVLSINSKYGQAYFSRGVAFIFQGQYSKAIADFNQFLQFEPKSIRALYNRGLAYALQGQYDQALADFNKTLALNPQDAQAHYLRGFVYYKQGHAAQARSDYQKALSLNPDWVKEAASGGKSELDNYALILQGKAPKPPGSKVAAQKAEAAHKQQALTLARKAKYDQALAEINQALTQDPRDAETYNRRGGIYTLQGHYAKAVADFSKALELNPRYAKAYYNRALAYYYQGKYDQAINDLTKAIKLKPKDVASYNNRGLAYMQKGNYERAIDDFNVATILNPKLADAYYNKAVSCEKVGRRDAAREAYAAFVKLAPPAAKDQIEQAQRKLR